MRKTLMVVCIWFMYSCVLASNTSLEQNNFEKDLSNWKTHKFNENQIRSFVYYWYSLHDKHAAIGKSYELLATHNLNMQYPEITVKNKRDYKIWYDNVEKNVKSNRHIVQELNVSFLPNHQYQVDIVVIWQALDKSGNFMNEKVTQKWLLVDGVSNDHPYIQSYNILSFVDNS